jgi:hypothetical protein
MGTTRSYACATQAGLTQLGSNVMRPSRGVLPVRPRRATLASLYLWRGAFIGQHALERCPQKPITIPRSQLCSWNARRELYQHVGNFVGSVVSPILSNIYMDRLDKYVEQTLIPAYTRERTRGRHPEYSRLEHKARYYRRIGNLERAETLRKEMQQYPSVDPYDPEYRRLLYVRYADDFLLGLAGPRAEAEEIKARLATFLQTTLKLTLAVEKTLITSATNSRARFLGYEIGVFKADRKFDDKQRCSINGRIGLYIPEDVIQTKRKRYLRDGKVMHRPELRNDSEYDIVTRYQWEYRGLVEYYGVAQNLRRLSHLRYTMETSLLKTIAGKNRISLGRVDEFTI